MRVGFIGLGVMGRPMAAHVLANGFELGLWARRKDAAAELLANGAQWFDSPAELAQRCDVVVSIVTYGADVEQIAFGPHGLAKGFRAGAVHIDMSTISPALARSLAARYAELGVEWLDAPVSGGGVAAQAASLAIMAGGEQHTLDRVRPVLECFGSRIVHIGEAGAGQVAKACNQMLMVSIIQACAEAMHLARSNGVDLDVLRPALMGGSAASRVLEVFGERMSTGNFAAGVQARLHHKDFGLLMDDAVKLGAPLPVAAEVWQQLNALMGCGWGSDDTASLIRLLSK